MEYNMSIKEVCKMLNITRPTLDKLRKEGLPYINVGRNIRFNKEEVIQWLKENSNA